MNVLSFISCREKMLQFYILGEFHHTVCRLEKYVGILVSRMSSSSTSGIMIAQFIYFYLYLHVIFS